MVSHGVAPRWNSTRSYAARQNLGRENCTNCMPPEKHHASPIKRNVTGVLSTPFACPRAPLKRVCGVTLRILWHPHWLEAPSEEVTEYALRDNAGRILGSRR